MTKETIDMLLDCLDYCICQAEDGIHILKDETNQLERLQQLEKQLQQM